MLPSKLSRAAHRAATTTSISASGSTASLTAACSICLHVGNPATSRRTHQRRDSSSKASSSSSSSSAERCSSSGGSKAAGSVGKGGVTSSTTAATEVKEDTVKERHVGAPCREKLAKSAKSISSADGKGRVRPPRRSGSSMTQDTSASKKSTSTGVQQSEDARLRDHFAGLPSVPSVQGLSESELSLSTFFSLHRPLAPHNPFPTPTNPEDFHKLFTPTPPAEDPWANGNSAERRPEDVTFTLHSMVEQLDNAIESVENAAREGVKIKRIVVRQEGEGGVRHLDPRQGMVGGGGGREPEGRGRPQQKLQAVLNPSVRGQVRPKSLEELQAMFKPFRVPPPPEPMPDEVKSRTRGVNKSAATDSEVESAGITMAEGEEAAQLEDLASSEPQQKTFTTTITVTESTYPNGRKTYSAESSPIVAATLSSSTAEGAQTSISEAAERPMTRRERIRKQVFYSPTTQSPALDATAGLSVRVPLGQRGSRVRNQRKMILISVKRQRKLKMKKHKYKKLMKRTRTLRRKLERT